MSGSQEGKIIVSSSVANFKDKIAKKNIKWPGTLFIGMYHYRDYLRFITTRGKKTVFWCGSDILNLKILNWFPNFSFWQWLLKKMKARHICENEVERNQLLWCGIGPAEIHPAFFGNVDDYPLSYKHSNNPHIWMCVHPGREEEYGVKEAIGMVCMNPGSTLHVYGIDGKNYSGYSNVIFHGQILEEQMDKEIKNYQVAFRGNKFDGFSEVVAKGILLGQKIISKIYYPKMDDREYWYNKLKEF